MKVYLFDLLPYDRHFDEFKAERFMPWPQPGSHFDPQIAARTYAEHLAVWEEMDRIGYDGVGLNEHHTMPHGLMNSPNIMAAAGAQRTKRLKFFILGNLLPLHNPLRIAEDLAMVDCLSGGRIMAGFARGVPREYKVYDVPMAESRGRFDEALDVILKAWTEDGRTRGRRCAAAQHQSRRAAARGASRAGAPVRPRGPACPAGASSDARAGGGSLCVIRCRSDAVSFDSPKIPWRWSRIGCALKRTQPSSI